MRNGWNTPLPPLDDLKVAIDRLAEDSSEPLDVHTVKLELNGQHGGWDVTLEATDRDMEDRTLVGILERNGTVGDLTERGT